MTKITVAGGGAGGALHASAISAVPGARLRAIAARTSAGAEYVASQAGTEAVQLTDIPKDTDAVIVATTPWSHEAVARRLIGEGTPVLIEKPLAPTLSGCDRIVSAATASGTLTCYAENVIFAPVIDATLRRRQILGDISNLEVRFHEPPPLEPTIGAIGSSALSAIALALLLAGDARLEALRCVATSSRPDGLDDTARIELRFSNQVIVVVDVGWTDGAVEWSAQVASAEMVLTARLFPETILEVNGVEADLGVTSSDNEAQRLVDLGFTEQMKGFAAAASGKGGRVCPAGFGTAVLEVVYAAYASAASGGEESLLPYQGDRDQPPNQPWLDR